MAILGESFKPYVRNQINVRQDKLSLRDKDDDILRYITSKTSFLRLTSGVNISSSVAQNLGVIGLEGSLLAEKYVLFSSKFNNQFTSDLGYSPDGFGSNFNVSYGFNSDPNFGLVPPPGLTMATINTLNRGTIREATINLVCHNLYQFKIINALFLKLKYSLLLEWGHTLYFNNGSGNNLNPELINSKLIPNLSDGFLNSKWSSDQLLNEIEKQRNESCGNYDAFFGVIKNFNWELQENGSYNVMINAISQGDVIDSLKINTNLTPEITVEGSELQYQKSTLHKILGDITKKIVDGPDGPGGTSQNYLHGWKGTDSDIALNTDNISRFTGITSNYKEPLDIDSSTTRSNSILANNEGLSITFPSLQVNTENNQPQPQYYIKLGTLLRIIESFLLYYDLEKTTENKSHPAIFYIDHDFDKNECLTTPRHMSVDPLTCIIPLDFNNKSDNQGLDTSVIYFYGYTEKTYDITFTRDIDGTIIVGNAEAPISTTTNSLPDAPDGVTNFDQELIVGASISDIPTNRELIVGLETYKSIFGALSSVPGAPDTENVTVTTRTYTRTAQATINNESQSGTLKYVEKGFRSDNKFIGKTMHIYVNINKIIEVLNNNIDGNGDVLLQNFLSQLMGSISSALCSINNFDLDYDETTNRFSIIDTAVFPLKYKNVNNVAKFNINLLKESNNGGGSFVTNFGLKSDVFGQISNAIALGAQANGNTLTSNSTPISSFNEGITDRIMTVKRNANVTADPNKGFYQFKEAYTRYEQFKVRVTSEDVKVGVTTSDIDLYRSSLVDLMKFDLGVYTITNNIPGTGFIPLNLQLTMDGLSGIRQYQTFDIDETLLPNEYTDKLKFITTTVTHKIDTKGWETTISSLGVPKNNKPPIDVDKDIPQIEVKIEPKKTVNITESQPPSTDKCGKANSDTVNTVYPRSVKWQRGPDPVKVPATNLPGYTIKLADQTVVSYTKTLKSYQEVIQAIEKVIDQLAPNASASDKKLVITAALAVSIAEQGSGGAIKGFNNNLTGTEASGFAVFKASDVNGKVSLTEGGTGKKKYYYSFATLEAGYVPLVSKILERNMFASSGDPNEFAWRYYRDWNGYGARTLPDYKSGKINDCTIIAGKEKLYNKALEAVNTYSKYK